METNLEFESYLLQHIPISSAMGVSVVCASSGEVILKAPLKNNINHKSTVFGGSLNAVATLACWSLLHLNLKEMGLEDFQIVIFKSEISYEFPVVSDFTAACRTTDLADWECFHKTLSTKGKARIKLTAHISDGSKTLVSFSGQFVAIIGTRSRS